MNTNTDVFNIESVLHVPKNRQYHETRTSSVISNIGAYLSSGKHLTRKFNQRRLIGNLAAIPDLYDAVDEQYLFIQKIANSKRYSRISFFKESLEYAHELYLELKTLEESIYNFNKFLRSVIQTDVDKKYAPYFEEYAMLLKDLKEGIAILAGLAEKVNEYVHNLRNAKAAHKAGASAGAGAGAGR